MRPTLDDLFNKRKKDDLSKSNIFQRDEFKKERISRRDIIFDDLIKQVENLEERIDKRADLIDRTTNYDNIGKHLIGNKLLNYDFRTLTGKNSTNDSISKENIDCFSSIAAYGDGNGEYRFDYDPAEYFNLGTSNHLKDEINRVYDRLGIYSSGNWIAVSILAIFLIMMKRFVRSVLFGLCGKLRFFFGISIGTIIVHLIVRLLNLLFLNAVRFPYCKEQGEEGDDFASDADLRNLMNKFLLNLNKDSDAVCYNNVSKYTREPKTLEQMMAKQLLNEIASNGFDSMSYDDNDISTYIYYKNMKNNYEYNKQNFLSTKQNISTAYAKTQGLNTIVSGATVGETFELKLVSDMASQRIIDSYKDFLLFVDKGFTDIYNSMRLNLVVASYFCCSIQIILYILLYYDNPDWTADKIIAETDFNELLEKLKDSNEYKKIVSVTKLIEMIIEFLGFTHQIHVNAGLSASILTKKGFLDNIQTIIGQSTYQFMTLILKMLEQEIGKLNRFVNQKALFEVIDQCFPVKASFNILNCGQVELQKFFDNLFAEINQKTINNVLGFNFFISSVSNKKTFNLFIEFLNYIFDNLGILYIDCFQNGINLDGLRKHLDKLRGRNGFRNYHDGDVQVKYDYDPNDFTKNEDGSENYVREVVERFNNKFFSEYDFNRDILDNNVKIYEIIINKGKKVKTK